MKRTGTIAVCGEAVIDMVQVGQGAEPLYRAVPGGSPYNVAVGLGRLGAPVAFVGQLSTDPNGARQLRRLEDNGVSTRHVRCIDRPASLAYAFPPTDGQPDMRYAFYLDGTSESGLDDPPSSRDFGTDVGCIHFGSFSAIRPATAPAIRALVRGLGALVSFDPNFRPTLFADVAAARAAVEDCVTAAHVVKLSDADLTQLYPGSEEGAVIGRWLGLGPRMIVLTRGPRGATVYTAGERVSVPSRSVEVIDTVGAGDAFMAAFLWGLRRRELLALDAIDRWTGPALGDAARIACKAAAIVCSRVGPDPPTVNELA